MTDDASTLPERAAGETGSEARSEPDHMTVQPPVSKLLAKMGTEFGPLLLFFAANGVAGIFWGTAVFMAATAVAAGFAWWKEGRLPLVPVVSLAFIIALGAMTLVTKNELWIQIRPTILNGGFAVLLVISVLIGRPGLKIALGTAVHLDEAGWRGLSLRVAGFLTLLAVANEIVWRTMGVDAWVAYKTFFVLPANAVFLLSQWPYVQRHRPQAAPGQG